MINSKLVVEYQRQSNSSKFINTHKSLSLLINDIKCTDGLINCKVFYFTNAMNYIFALSYPSKVYTTDIPVKLTMMHYTYDTQHEPVVTEFPKPRPTVTFYDSFKTMEMNVDNLIVAIDSCINEYDNAIK